MHNTIRDNFCAADPTIARRFAEATFLGDNRDLLKVSVPSLILQSADDRVAPVEVGQYMQRHMPACSLQLLDINGHCAHMSHPEMVIEATRAYLSASEISATSKAGERIGG